MKRIFVDSARVKENSKNDLKPVIVISESEENDQVTYADIVIIKTKQGDIIGRLIYKPDHLSGFGEKVWLELDEKEVDLEIKS